MRMQTMKVGKIALVGVVVFAAGFGAGWLRLAAYQNAVYIRSVKMLLKGDLKQRERASRELVKTQQGAAYLYSLFADMPKRPVGSDIKIAALLALGSAPQIKDFLPSVMLAAFQDSDPQVRLAAVMVMKSYYEDSVCKATTGLIRTLDRERDKEVFIAKVQLLATITGDDATALLAQWETGTVVAVKARLVTKTGCK